MLMATCAGAPEKPPGTVAVRAEKTRNFKIRIESSSNRSLRSWFVAGKLCVFREVASSPTSIDAIEQTKSRIVQLHRPHTPLVILDSVRETARVVVRYPPARLSRN